jgi:bis(5'-nucleosyl)-tetraphosphatase (symmetrical)
MSIYVIGDIQGCFDTLQRLLERIDFDDARDSLWFVGDLVNRGPQSLATLRFVHGLGARAVTVLGNHDLHLLAVAHGHRRAKPSDTLDEILRAPDRDELLDWLRKRPLLHRDDATGFVMVHAGIPHIWDLEGATARAREVEKSLASDDYDELLAGMYGDQPAQWSDGLRNTKRLRVIINYFTRMRVIDSVGALELTFNDGLNAVPAGYQPWFEFFRSAPPPYSLVFGHWAALNGECDVARMHALDTGCVWGNSLTALRLVPLERFSVASVEF